MGTQISDARWIYAVIDVDEILKSSSDVYSISQ